MDFQLTPISEPGRRLVALAEEHSLDFATRAEQHDREGTFPVENFAAMRKSGLLGACVPEKLGGMGVDSIHDVTVCINRLARGDGSTAIAVCMHLVSTWMTLVRSWNVKQEADRHELTPIMRKIATGDIVICNSGTEPGTNQRHPFTEAVRVPGGFRLNGRKTFGTLSPVATHFAVFAKIHTPEKNGGFSMGAVSLLRGIPGFEIKENWDAVGMRASGSHELVFTDCFVPEAMVTVHGAWGRWTESLLTLGTAGILPLLAAFLGIGEAARDIALKVVKMRRSVLTGQMQAERYPTQRELAELEVDLAAARGTLSRNALLVERFFREHKAGSMPMDEFHLLMKDTQCAKAVVNQKSIDIVNHAMTAVGGASFLSKNPLSRLYRDVRAGPFMMPLSPHEAFDYIGRLTLGLDPDPEALQGQ